MMLVSTRIRLFALVLLTSLAVPTASIAQQSGLPVSTVLPGSNGQGAGGGLLDILGQSLGGGPGGEILDPELAYLFSADTVDDVTLRAHWDIAEGYYLYREKFSFELTDPAGVSVGEVSLPDGDIKEDEFFGRMEVYHNGVDALLRINRPAALEGPVTLKVGYQGCAEVGICYPPMSKVAQLTLPPGGGAAMTTATPAAGTLPVATAVTVAPAFVSEQDAIARTLAVGSGWLVPLTFFGFGLLLAFTPCVFPMIPILSSIIVGQGERLSTRRSFLLSLVFVVAMAATYTVAGVAAGLFGGNLQAVFQAPWILITFSIVFVLLALGMFGLYQIQLPASLQTRLSELGGRQSGGTYAGVAVMGLLSALIVGPCVAAPLAGALIYIGQTGDAMLGGTALFAMSMGMGAPLLLIGASAGRLLPKVGPWMDKVKVAFGFMLLAVAIYMLERILPGWISMVLWAVLLIYAAIYMGALDQLQGAASGWRRMWKATGLIALTYGVLLMVGAAGGGEDVFRPLRGSVLLSAGAQVEQRLQFKPVKGLQGLRTELQRASAQGQPVMLDFYADWCVTCKDLERKTFTDSAVQAALAGTLLLQTDVTLNDERDQELLTELGIFGPPAILFFGIDGQERRNYRLVGFIDPDEFESHVRSALAGDTT